MSRPARSHSVGSCASKSGSGHSMTGIKRRRSATLYSADGDVPVMACNEVATTVSECCASTDMSDVTTMTQLTHSAASDCTHTPPTSPASVASTPAPIPVAVPTSMPDVDMKTRKRDSRIYCDNKGLSDSAPVYHEIVALKFERDAVTGAHTMLVYRLYSSDVKDGVFSGHMHVTPVALQGEPCDAAVSPRGIIAVATREVLTLLHMETKENCPPDHYRVVGRLQVPWGCDVTSLRFSCKARLEVALSNGSVMVLGTQRVRNTYMEHTDGGDCKGCLRRSICGCVGYIQVQDRWVPLHDMKDCEVNMSEACRCDDCKPEKDGRIHLVLELMAATVADSPIIPIPGTTLTGAADPMMS